jgi:hypothetical protein
MYTIYTYIVYVHMDSAYRNSWFYEIS